MLHNKGDFDLVTEVDLIAAQIFTTLRAARHQRLLICDKTIINVLVYARLVLTAPSGSRNASVLDALAGLCRAWAPGTYDAVFHLADHYRPGGDPLRAKVAHRQADTAHAVRDAYTEVGIPLIDVPTGLNVTVRVAWIAGRVDPQLTTLGR